jgi:hypothetical protein
MVNEAILEGLKNALAKGESLQSAMQSFMNAGYNSAEVEEASRNLHVPAGFSQQVKFSVTQNAMPVQKVSQYQEKTKTPNKTLIIVLIIFLVVTISSLAGILIFKDEVINLLGKLF